MNTRSFTVTTALLFTVLGASSTCPLAYTQAIQPLLLQGDPVPGTPGTLAGISDVAVNDSGEWIVRALLAGGSTSEAAVLNGASVLNEGDTLFDPPGLTVQRFDDIDIGADSTVWWNIDTSAATATDEIVYRNLVQTAREGSDLTSGDVPPNTFWRDVDGIQISDNGDLLILGEIDSSLVNGTQDSTLVRQSFDDQGILIAEDVLVLEGDVIAGSNDLVVDVGASVNAHDVSIANGHWIAYVRSDASQSSNDLVYVDGVAVAHEGKTGPLVGTIWGALNSNGVDITNDGDYVFRGVYQVIGGGALNAIFLNGQPVLQQGDTSASLAPDALLEFGRNTAVQLGANGSIVYYGKTDNPDAALNEGYFLNDTFLVQENVTQVGSNVIATLVGGPAGLALSPSGRYVIFEAFLGDGRNGAFFIDLGLIMPMESCASAAATLTHVDGLPLLGATVSFELDGEQDLGVLPAFLLSTEAIVGWPPCGLMTSFGELLIDVSIGNGNPQVSLLGNSSTGAPVPFDVTVPNDPALLNRDFFAQGMFWDFNDQSPAEDFRLSNGLMIQLAMP